MKTEPPKILAQDLAALRQVRTGDVMLVAHEGGIAQSLIESVQLQLLRDLVPEWLIWVVPIEEQARYTHAALVYREQRVRGGVVEMAYPRCRFRRFENLERGDVIMIRRPVVSTGAERGKDASPEICYEAVMQALIDVQYGTPYPIGELLTYWVWSMRIGKLMFGRKFRDIFTVRGREVCSGSVWKWLMQAGLNRDTLGTPDSWPEAWYPARLAVDMRRFRTLGVWRIG